MASRKGTIVLMGSGELTATMVEVHKKMLARRPDPSHAVFLDTPAGFQLNVDEISKKAVEYFRVHVQKQLKVASYKSSEITTAVEAETAFHQLRNADFVLIGPGSPTYAIDQLEKTPIPDILKKVVESGGCLVAASAAALAMGRYTLPVYEIYKVGQRAHWVDGLDILSQFGFHPVVVPHWNNAEGGTHDTRFCFMGKPRFQQLEALLPEAVTILGIDEHTACIIDLEAQHVDIQGIGNVTIRKKGRETTFGKGESIPFRVLMENVDPGDWMPQKDSGVEPVGGRDVSEQNLLSKVATIEASFGKGLADLDPQKTTQALLTLDGIIWDAQKKFEDEQHISQAREILRESIVLLGQTLGSSQHHLREYLSPLVEQLLQLRATFRNEKKWSEADSIRDIIMQANILVEDTKDGVRWRIAEKGLLTQNQGDSNS
jgi:cyanophycinase-like exopeptidase